MTGRAVDYAVWNGHQIILRDGVFDVAGSYEAGEKERVLAEWHTEFEKRGARDHDVTVTEIRRKFTEVRRKCCRNCLFGKQPLGTKDLQGYARMRIAQGTDSHFVCHEHSRPTICAGYAARYRDRITTPVRRVQENGDLKADYAHMTREQMDACTYIGRRDA